MLRFHTYYSTCCLYIILNQDRPLIPITTSGQRPICSRLLADVEGSLRAAGIGGPVFYARNDGKAVT